MELKGNIKDFPLPDVVQLVGLSKKTGMLSITFKNNNASLYFKNGNIVHASMLNFEGKDAVMKMFHLQEGDFHFFVDEMPDVETINLHPMNVLMEAARLFDESREAAGDFDAQQGGSKKKSHEEKIKNLKNDMIKLVKDLYGSKASKIEALIKGCSDSEIELISSCDKIEKYIRVFLDTKNSKIVADKLRHLIEEAH